MKYYVCVWSNDYDSGAEIGRVIDNYPKVSLEDDGGTGFKDIQLYPNIEGCIVYLRLAYDFPLSDLKIKNETLTKEEIEEINTLKCAV